MPEYNSTVYEIREKKRKQPIYYSNVSLVVLALVVVLLAKGTFNMWMTEKEARKGRADIEYQMASLQAREDFLSREVRGLETESGLEKEIRSKFNVKKEGEEVVIIVDATTSSFGTDSEDSSAGKAWRWIKGVFK